MRVLERRAGTHGELALRGDGEHFEIISNGVFLMDTRGGASERLLVRAALDRLTGPVRVLIGGLGVGFSVAEALRAAHVSAVTVIDCEPAVIAWQSTYLRSVTDGALDDPRVRVHCRDLLEWLRGGDQVYDAVCLDIDNGPEWTVTDTNAALYEPAGLDLLAARLRPGGALTVWSAAASAAFQARLRARFTAVAAHRVPVARGEPDVVYLASRAG